MNSTKQDISITQDEEYIIKTVCSFYNISFTRIKRIKKTKGREMEHIAWPRQVLEYCLLRFTGENPYKISEITGANQATVRYSHKKIQEQLDIKSAAGKRVETLLSKLEHYFQPMKEADEIEEAFSQIAGGFNLLKKSILKIKQEINKK